MASVSYTDDRWNAVVARSVSTNPCGNTSGATDDGKRRIKNESLDREKEIER